MFFDVLAVLALFGGIFVFIVYVFGEDSPPPKAKQSGPGSLQETKRRKTTQDMRANSRQAESVLRRQTQSRRAKTAKQIARERAQAEYLKEIKRRAQG